MLAACRMQAMSAMYFIQDTVAIIVIPRRAWHNGEGYNQEPDAHTVKPSWLFAVTKGGVRKQWAVSVSMMCGGATAVFLSKTSRASRIYLNSFIR